MTTENSDVNSKAITENQTSHNLDEPPKEKANEAVSEGDKLRDVGMALAAARSPDQVTLGRLAMVRTLLQSPDGTATIDDATSEDDLTNGFADGGKWRGTVTRSLVKDGIAKIVGTVKSRRKSRHSGYVAMLKLVDRDEAQNYLRKMTTAMWQIEPPPQGESVGADAINLLGPQASQGGDSC
jgi:hypothetical protein